MKRYSVFAFTIDPMHREGVVPHFRGMAMTIDEAVAIVQRADRFDAVQVIDTKLERSAAVRRPSVPQCEHDFDQTWSDDARAWVAKECGRCLAAERPGAIVTVDGKL